jgi:coenzyme F420-0:L-glutamate ligase/coenzyme F420-1:gamma-L-glutamate ligase
VLLPVDPDRSARRIRDGLRARTGAEVAVVISDTFGRPWRRGAVDVAVGCAGIAAVLDLRGEPDSRGRPLSVTEVAVADELAGAAELVMGKLRQVPAVLVRGYSFRPAAGSARGLVRAPHLDLFR